MSTLDNPEADLVTAENMRCISADNVCNCDEVLRAMMDANERIREAALAGHRAAYLRTRAVPPHTNDMAPYVRDTLVSELEGRGFKVTCDAIWGIITITW